MQKNIVLASTSTLYGQDYLAYLSPVVQALFAGVNEIIFIPFARPGGISHDDYTKRAADFFAQHNIAVKGLHTFASPLEAIQQAKGFFTGGGNTFLLVKQLHELGLMGALKAAVENGTAYLGTSAGSNIGGINMQTTNDMPIVYPPSFETMGLVPFNLNPHYLDPLPGLQHMGETRETRIAEFHTQNAIPVVGLREGSWIRVRNEVITLEGTHTARIFEQGKVPYELNVQEKIVF
ncbi:dipeptidase E [Chitinophaga skermanii]|uniref:Dipeptidase E n=1 Tax=Chitinophaga skermanii TaxID=331697 RepID=A0A327R3I1_9BACT|nr:dipeptidase PepE [Chitinophaga skermanii]RAJ08437.1 dipeptidase E [Chitinophaga skermanii]